MELKLIGEIIKTSDISKELKASKESQKKIEITTNRFYINEQFEKEDVVDIIFVAENNSYIYKYKERDKEAPKSFNSGFASIQVNIPEGSYDIYIKINDTYYNTKLNVNF